MHGVVALVHCCIQGAAGRSGLRQPLCEAGDGRRRRIYATCEYMQLTHLMTPLPSRTRACWSFVPAQGLSAQPVHQYISQAVTSWGCGAEPASAAASAAVLRPLGRWQHPSQAGGIVFRSWATQRQRALAAGTPSRAFFTALRRSRRAPPWTVGAYYSKPALFVEARGARALGHRPRQPSNGFGGALGGAQHTLRVRHAHKTPSLTLTTYRKLQHTAARSLQLPRRRKQTQQNKPKAFKGRNTHCLRQARLLSQADRNTRGRMQALLRGPGVASCSGRAATSTGRGGSSLSALPVAALPPRCCTGRPATIADYHFRPASVLSAQPAASSRHVGSIGGTPHSAG